MTDKFVELDFETWETIFKPQVNTIDPNASFQNENDEGIMFETYGDEVEYVQATDNHYIWTYGDGDNGGGYIWNGYHYINRLGYFISTVPWEDGVTYQIKVSSPWFFCENCHAEFEDDEDNTIRDAFDSEDLEKCPKCATIEEMTLVGLENNAYATLVRSSGE